MTSHFVLTQILLMVDNGYRKRMRGYHGMSGRESWYGHPDRMKDTHEWVFPHSSYSAREFPIGWNGIDGDTEPTANDFF